ncbi:MAG: saccharopine dehydrogenase NADP-binding domain-containing protein [Proteobacteria bacterium]|nr:saccharopine dehydrogenase NADP-binding domain-containing protein [Pseudomonadota bacterium]
MNEKTILILGGYGNFGRRIAENLAVHTRLTLIIAGRSIQKASEFSGKLQSTSVAVIKPLALDIYHSDFLSVLKKVSADIVIHSCGPFQGQDYCVAKACIEAGSHYIDLADDRRFVCDFSKLDRSAKANNVLLISGASSVPGLSSTVIEHYKDQFATIDSVDIGIAPGNKTERGEATVKAILSYTGHHIKVFSRGKWENVFGWMNPRRFDFGDVVGKRWLANVDVPDLELFPDKYKIKKTMRFQAGLELSVLHLIMVVMAFLVKIRLVKNWSKVVKPIIKISNWFLPFGSDVGGMFVCIKGMDKKQKPKSIQWNLYATDGMGPYVPTFSATILAEKLLSGTLNKTGATACLGMYTMEEFDTYASKFGVYIKSSPPEFY